MQVKYVAHPEDEQMLTSIREHMIKLRRAQGWNQVELSRRINGSTHAAGGLEKGDFDWHLSRLQQWVIPFDLMLKVTPMFPPEQHEQVLFDPEVNPFYELQLKPGDNKNWPMWQRAYLVAYLKRMREELGITRAQLGAKMGVTAGAISTWEINGGNVRLLRLLNLSRALGSRILLEVK